MGDYDFVVTRKPQPEPVYFICSLCRVRKDNPWADAPERSGLLVCASCADHWGRSHATIVSIGYADRRVLRRLSAFTTALDWEVKNGSKRFWRNTNI